ncbi:MAG: hypothetical protein COV10_03895 [Candidatus Vogelbacteria bacterium CG10_big_fil_rev_8_21_14_0_10_51_16]|uniref:Membrane insertase YidC/Oxa/ALB C-terminal domain-containing protein n=1 Tax=Candidatus Vogelbacteria bacterium CG10_big_fil_rev_8_21_14_0_10_51_16 TaxID=1975045 RepID=A0A2H0RDS0_9BACT|nr:MAG: hypothetical protein COV10_03895 [Candidatus Vogelbacteria bacterium CG10_big_fil_rev_8_21_14_0_10_51_16]
MFSFLYHTIFLEPVYNLLVFFASILPTHDVGLSIIIVTVAIRLITLPLQHRSVVVQRKLKTLEPHVQKIRDTHKDNPQEQGMKIMALYREHGVNPFSGFLTLLIQIPIIIALYHVVSDIRIIPELLYSFTPTPDVLNTTLLGLIDVSERSIALAIMAGLFQFLQTKYAFPDLPKDDKEVEPSFQRDFAKSMQVQMKYFLPLFIVVFGATLPAAVSIYWAVNSGLALVHELYVKKNAEEIGE